MLDHNRPYVEKMHYIHAELAGHVHKLDVKLQFVWEWLFFLCSALSFQALPLWI